MFAGSKAFRRLGYVASVPLLAYGFETLSPLPSSDLPQVYSPGALSEHFISKPFTVLRRVSQLVASLPPLAVSPTPEKLTETLIDLGPAFIKLGQQLSIRPDLLPPRYLEALSKLQDNCPAFDDAVAFRIIATELGTPVTTLFPDGLVRVAAASLGQVYRGRLASSNSLVAVKVQRPDIKPIVALDLFLVHSFFRLFDALSSPFRAVPPDFANLVSSFAHGSYGEVDYAVEASSQAHFKEALERHKIDVYVPSVFPEHSTERVLTTEWIDGVKISDCDSDTINSLIPTGVEMFMCQLLSIGRFHADAHPANLLVQTVVSGAGRKPRKRLALIDFGLTASITKQDQKAMTVAIYHLLTSDFHTLITVDTKSLGFLEDSFDTTELEPVLRHVIEKGMAVGSDMRKRRSTFHEISSELNEIFFNHPFSVPPFFALITRGLGLLEGIALKGDSDFDIFQAARPFAMKKGLQIGLEAARSQYNGR
jgi:aarF domain-containing kinase